MRLLIFSDSHGQLPALRRILHKETQPDVVYHLGDGAADFRALSPSLPNIGLYGHKGNCDSTECGFPTESLHQFCGVNIFACHGHTRYVQSGMTELMFAAMERGAAVCLYGHTHIPDISYQNGIWFVNPGAAKDGRYALLDISEEGTIYPSLSLNAY